MKLSNGVKPISYFKAHASEVINDVVENQNTMVITQNGEAKVVLQDIRSYEQMQESLAMLKILALSTKSINEGNFRSANDTFSDLDSKIADRERS
ncbi:type II toxin-antitoxin system Phd/YefM family antitoxin [Spirochaeta isovalerica]|uniref:Antitoxin n=1 Tax=Spirochaeta isovalerica TaxID=150 RepID=A0A841RBT4_9SPIO|nr:type II toxin-antitoxin system Phd/YefM family antitoxin [Spirochaeta isovalerica]MBB6481156.1 prevent-host-death family protein [Spirochaeta isovalerica]